MKKDIKNLVHKLDSAIESYDTNCSIEDFAKGVVGVLKDQYGKHNFNTFKKVLELELNKEDENCPCCNGTGKIEVDDDWGIAACLTCNGRGILN